MAKSHTTYICNSCGAISFQWKGKCTDCGSWDSFEEKKESTLAKKTKLSSTISLADISNSDICRIKTGIDEFDRVLGGGVVASSVILLAGDPGIGKSTLMLQAASKIAESGKSVLYIAGEESPKQIKLRATRLKSSGDIFIASGDNACEAANRIAKHKPNVVIIDSIQSLASPGMPMGTPAMLRETAATIVPIVKESNAICFFIGHVTKDGTIAGPKIIEHMVDVVINFEGERGHPFRLLRATKNRFGATDEVGVFTMTREGLAEVKDPSGLFLEAKPEDAPGSIVFPSLQGSRPLLVEIQALVSKSPLAYPRRTSLGVDPNRLSLLTAVLEKNAGVILHDQDVFLNVAGGIKLKEPAADLGIVASIYSSYSSKPVSNDLVFIGEVGLAGEVRSVQNIALRLKEASKLGFKKAITPKYSGPVDSKIETIQIKKILDCLELIKK